MHNPVLQAYPTFQSMDEEDGQEVGEVGGGDGIQREVSALRDEVAGLREALREKEEVVRKVSAGGERKVGQMGGG